MTKTNCMLRIFILIFIPGNCIPPPIYMAEPDPDPDPAPDEPGVDPPLVSALRE